MIEVYHFVAPNNNRRTEKTDSVLFPCCHPHRCEQIKNASVMVIIFNHRLY